jgi:hypothetical protein
LAAKENPMINTIVEPEIVKLSLSPVRRMGALANGQHVVKSFRYLLTDHRQFDILQSGPGWRGPSIETARVHHLARRRGGRLAARSARAAADDAGGRVS